MAVDWKSEAGGAGRPNFLQAIFGVHRLDAGKISLNGRPLRIHLPRMRLVPEWPTVPEDRKLHGLALNLSITENSALPNLRKLGNFGFLRKKERNQLAKAYAERLNVSYRHLNELALLLSGGNQQKIVLGKWLAAVPPSAVGRAHQGN